VAGRLAGVAVLAKADGWSVALDEAAYLAILLTAEAFVHEYALNAGGGVLLRGFRDLIASETGLPVALAGSPLTCVAEGSGRALAHFDDLARPMNRSRLRFTGGS
jgi:MreB/Mbl protein